MIFKSKLFLPFILFFGLVSFHMLLMPRDIWDGLIIEYASYINDLSGIEVYFLESGWFLQYPLSIFLINIAKIFGLKYVQINALFVLILMLVVLRESIFIASNILKLPPISISLTLLLIATFSSWNQLLSSIMTFHFFCIAIGLLSIRYLHFGNNFLKLMSIFGFMIAFNYQSLLVFLPFLSYIYDLFGNKNLNNKFIKAPSLYTFLVLIFGIVLFLLFRYYYPPFGLYEDYNRLKVFDGFQVIGLTYFALQLGTYLMPMIAVFTSILFALFFLDRINFFNIMQNIKINFYQIIWLILFLGAAAFPYIAVGKGSVLWNVGGWSGRQAFTLALPLSFLTGYMFNIFYKSISVKLIQKIIILGILSIVLLQSILLTSGVFYKLNRQAFETQLVSLIQENQDRIGAGKLLIFGEGIPGPTFSSYESNFLMFEATDRSDWWSSISSNVEENLIIPCHMQKSSRYHKKYIYDFKSEHLDNESSILIEAHGFIGIKNIILNSFGFSNNQKINLIKINSMNDSFKSMHICEL